jgi:hypothetical protein
LKTIRCFFLGVIAQRDTSCVYSLLLIYCAIRCSRHLMELPVEIWRAIFIYLQPTQIFRSALTLARCISYSGAPCDGFRRAPKYE